MTEIDYWIQHADFSTDEFEPATLDEAIQAFEAHDWTAENELRATREAAGEEWCPPGIGYDQAGRILHICPEPGESALVHYHFSTDRSLFGLLRRRVQDSRTSEGVSVEKVPELIRRFYNGEHDWLLGAL